MNLETALPAVIAAVRGSWDNVQSLSIKSTKSTSLPIWSCKLGTGDGARWHDSAIEDESEDDDDEEEEEVTTSEVPCKGKTSKTKQPPDQRKKLVVAKAT